MTHKMSLVKKQSIKFWQRQKCKSMEEVALPHCYSVADANMFYITLTIIMQSWKFTRMPNVVATVHLK